MKNFTRYGTIDFLRLLSDSVLPIIFWVLLIFGFDIPYIAALTVLSALIHELGHSVAIHVLAGKEVHLRGHSTGFRIARSETLSYKKEIAILLSGPFANILIFLIALPFMGAMQGYVRALALINLATGLSNLMPLDGYDGYGALKEILCSFGRADCVKHLETFSFILQILITFLSLYLIGRFGEGYWIFGLFFFGMLSKLFSFGKYNIFEE